MLTTLSAPSATLCSVNTQCCTSKLVLSRSLWLVCLVLVVNELLVPMRTVTERLVLRFTAPAQCENLR